MNWLTVQIDPNVASGMCVLLFGLLVLSMRIRKVATGVPYTFFSSPSRVVVRPVPTRKSTRDPKAAASPAPNSGPALGSGLEYTRRETAISKVPEGSAIERAASPDSTAGHNSDGMKTGPTPFSMENPFPGILAEIPALRTSPASVIIEANNSAEGKANELAKNEAPSAWEIAVAAGLQVESANAPESPIITENSEADRVEPEKLAMETNPETAPVPATCETKQAKHVLAFYNLPQQPFDVTPDPAYLYFSPSHREALTSVKEGIEHFRGFMVLVAEPGMGKTTLLNKLMDELSDSAQVVFLFQTQCNSRELLCFILNELEVDHAGMDIVAMHRALNQALLEEMLRGRRFVLIVDEAQNLQEPVLETIRLLSDFETTHSKLIQIVLAGQPQLADTLMNPGLVQLRQRISILSSLKQLGAAQTAEYIEHRLHASGWRGNGLFTAEAMARIADLSGGIPRRINNLCFNALLEGFHRGMEIIGADLVKEAAEKLNLEALVRRPQMAANARQSAAPAAETISTSQLARALAAALHAESRQYANSEK
jgi:general secretion pathway protein A